jgi:TonB family protein
VLENPDAAFPVAAKAAGVDGDVTFRATVDAAGRVQSVEILSVPQPGLGFEEAVRAAVSRWRFSPGLLRGTPVESTYNGGVRFSLTLPGQAIFAASSTDTWMAVRALVRRLKIPVDKADDARQLLVSGRTRYAGMNLPERTSLDVRPGFTPDRLVLHVYVTPGLEPARVAVGSVMDFVPVRPGEQERFVVYGHEDIARWFLIELAGQMHVRQEALSASADRRAEQAKALMPPGVIDACGTSPAPVAVIRKPDAAPSQNAVAAPTLLHEVKPIYPNDQLQQRKAATITFKGEITEHGTLVNPTMTDPVDAPQSFVKAAQLAFGLWRFAPAQQGRCPVRVQATFESAFTLRK